MSTEALAQAVLNQPEQPTAAAPEAPKQDTTSDEPLSARFAALARKQKNLDQERAKWKAERSTEEGELSEYRKWKEEQGKPRAKKNPIETLMEAGYTYEDATQFALNDGKPTPEHMVKEVESKMETFIREQKERDEAKKKSDEDSLKAQEQKAIDDFKENITSFCKTDGDKYELINLYSAHNTVFEKIEDHYNETMAEGKPVVLSKEEAADMVERELEALVDEVLKTKKFQSKVQPPKQDEPAPFSSKTLSNHGGASSIPAKTVVKTDEERIKRALALLG